MYTIHNITYSEVICDDYIDEKFIKDRIIQLRTQKGVSARDMSLSIGQNKNYINIIENGGNLPSINDLNELINEVKSLSNEAIKSLTAFVKETKKSNK